MLKSLLSEKRIIMKHKSIYLAPMQARSGSLTVSIGFMEMLKGNIKKVAFFRPVISGKPEEDSSITFMIEHFGLDITYEQCWGVQTESLLHAFAEGNEQDIYETLIQKLHTLYAAYDFVLIEGYPKTLLSSSLEFDINLEITKNLNIPLIPIFNAKEKSKEVLLEEILIATETITQEKIIWLASFVNRCNTSTLPLLKEALHRHCPDHIFYCFPEIPSLGKPTLGQVAHFLNAQKINAEPSQLDYVVHDKKIAAMGAEHYLEHISDGDLIIVPGDRIEILIVSILSYHAKNHPNIAGILLSGGISIPASIYTLISDNDTVNVPIFIVGTDSYQTALSIEKVPTDITPQSTQKIIQVKALFEKYVDTEPLIQRFKETPEGVMTPMMFLYRMKEQAKTIPQRIVLPESEDDRILKAADILLKRMIANIILLGDKEHIMQRAKFLAIDLSKAEIVDSQDIRLRERFAKTFYEKRKTKGLTLNAARDAMTHRSYFATMMVYEGMADGMVSGASHTTADTIRPALQIIKTKPGIDIVSSVFFMCLDTRVLVYGDCAVNLDPDAEALAQIAVTSAQTAQQFGIEPKVAMLSYSTGDSGHGPEVEKVRKATQLARQMRPDLPIEGPIQYDAAIDVEVAKKKLPHSKVAGHATVFIFPDLNTGNNTYKAVQRATGALAIGPVLQGLKKPVNDLSRGCSVEDIVNTVAITAVQAQEDKR
jgi:phosphate acetyltransferase